MVAYCGESRGTFSGFPFPSTTDGDMSRGSMDVDAQSGGLALAKRVKDALAVLPPSGIVVGSRPELVSKMVQRDGDIPFVAMDAIYKVENTLRQRSKRRAPRSPDRRNALPGQQASGLALRHVHKVCDASHAGLRNLFIPERYQQFLGSPLIRGLARHGPSPVRPVVFRNVPGDASGCRVDLRHRQIGPIRMTGHPFCQPGQTPSPQRLVLALRVGAGACICVCRLSEPFECLRSGAHEHRSTDTGAPIIVVLINFEDRAWPQPWRGCVMRGLSRSKPWSITPSNIIGVKRDEV